MRIKTEIQPCFFLTVLNDQKIVKQYHDKYNKIADLLNTNPLILNLVHSDLKNYGSVWGRKSSFTTEQVLRMLIVKTIEMLSFRDLIIRVSESDFLRNFTMIGMGKMMSFGFVNGAFKHIREETWEEINGHLAIFAKNEGLISSECLRIDSTVCESNIRYPTDWGLLWDSYRVLSRMMRKATTCDRTLDCGFRFHDKKVKKLCTFISTSGSRKNRSVKRKVKKNLRVLVERVENVTSKAHQFIANATVVGSNSTEALVVIEELKQILPLVQNVSQQARKAQIEGKKVPASERVFSIFEEHTELLKRGKVNKPVEFGHMVNIGQTKEKFITYYSVEENSRHDTVHKDLVLEDHKELFGYYPKVFAADKNYYVSMDDVNEWEEEIETFGVAKKGRRNADEINREHSDEFRSAQKFRAGAEGSISVLKRAFGLRRCINKGFSSFAATVGCIVFCHNIVQLAGS